jgi:fimbrial chaperone protein
MSRNILALLTWSVLTAFLPAVAHAMSVSPMHIEMTSVGKSGRSQFAVTNSGTTPMPVETAIKRLEIDETGVSHETVANDDFLVFPAQVMIAPGASQVFRVQWVGEPNLAKSQSYIVAVNQIPLKQTRSQSTVQVVMAFGIVIDVAPPVGRTNLKLVRTGTTLDKHGKRHATVTIENSSNVHGLLEAASLRFTSGAWSRTYLPGELAQGIGIGIIQPGRRRTFTMPDILPDGAGALQAKLDYPQR